MKLRVHSIAGRMPGWVEQACDDYGRRLPRELKPDWRTLGLGKRPQSTSPDELRRRDTDRLAAAIPDGDMRVVLDVNGASWSTDRLAEQVSLWQHSGRDISVIIGGPEGLTPTFVSSTSQAWSLSPLTLPHPLVRVVLIEQIYRAWSILQGHPYHK